MARSLSHELLERIDSDAGETLNMRLAKTAVAAKLPAMYIAAMLGVSRMAVHSWFRGGEIRQSRLEKIQGFIELLNEDLQAGALPKKSLAETKEYAERFSGRPVPSQIKLG
jgi:hypothetical protein